MSKIIINNKSRAEDIDVIRFVTAVINAGRISKDNTAYCYLTTFRDNFAVEARKTSDTTDTFICFDTRDGYE